MPRANPESSFESAARHLFRHIGDLNALRRNPLVQFILDSADVGSGGAALQEVQGAIIAAASRLHENSGPRSAKRAYRQQQIVVAACAGEAPAKTAERLGISTHHYYRERRAVAVLIAKSLLEEPAAQPKNWTITDPLTLLFTRAAALRDQGFANTAVSILKAEISRSPNDTVRLALESELARSLISLGRADLATPLLDERQPGDWRVTRDATRQWVHDHRTLTRALLAMERGGTDVGESLERLARFKIHSGQLDEEALDVIIESAEWYCDVGLFNKGRVMLNNAREFVRSVSHVPVRQQSAIALLAAYCAQETRDEFDLEYQWLSEAFALSTSNGSLKGILDATAGLMQYYMTAGYDEGVYRLAQDGLRIAQRADGTRLLQQFAMQAAGVLLKTRYWRTIDPLVFEVEKILQPGSLRWAYLKEFQGLLLMRKSQYDKAAEVLVKAYDAGRKTNNRWLEGLALRDLAISRHRNGAAGEGADLMKEALGLLEGHASIASLCETYESASRVLADRRLARLAVQFRSHLPAGKGRLDLPSGAKSKIASERLRVMPGLTAKALRIGRSIADQENT